jgi:hypothetical protein
MLGSAANSNKCAADEIASRVKMIHLGARKSEIRHFEVIGSALLGRRRDPHPGPLAGRVPACTPAPLRRRAACRPKPLLHPPGRGKENGDTGSPAMLYGVVNDALSQESTHA